jgi:hypothetical protein
LGTIFYRRIINMKKVFTVVLASMVTLLSVAADNPRDGRLRVSNFSRQDIFIVIDGRVIDDRDNHTMIGGLRPGYHNVKVYRKVYRGRRSGGLFGRGGGHTLLYNSSVYVTPQSEVRLVIDRGGQVYVDRQRGRGGRDRDWDDNDRRGRDRDRDYDRRDGDWRR